MKFQKLTLGLAGLAALASFSTAVAAENELCSPLQAEVTKEVTAAPESVLKVVAEKVAATPSCACEIVKAAIGASKADNATVVAIVEAAAAASPEQLPVVLACAAATAPKAAGALAAKFSDETEGSGKGVVGKEPVGKEPVGKAPVETPVVEDEYSEDFGFVRPGIGGIYLTIPNGAGGRSGFTDEEIRRLLRTGDYRLVNGELVRIVEIETTNEGPTRVIEVPTPPTPSVPAPAPIVEEDLKA